MWGFVCFHHSALYVVGLAFLLGVIRVRVMKGEGKKLQHHVFVSQGLLRTLGT